LEEISINKENIWELLAKNNQIEMISHACPFIWSVNPDEKNPTIYKCYLGPPQLSLINIDIYFDDINKENKKYKLKYREKYFEYLDNLFTIVFGSNHNYNVKDIFDVEFDILNAMSCNIIKDKDMDFDNYNLISKNEALKYFGFNWEEFCKCLGFKKVPDEFVTSNINYLLCGTKLLIENWNTSKWKTYWIYIYIRQISCWNIKGFDNLNNFQGLFVRGQKTNIDLRIKPVFPLAYLFNTFYQKNIYQNLKIFNLLNILKPYVKI